MANRNANDCAAIHINSVRHLAYASTLYAGIRNIQITLTRRRQTANPSSKTFGRRNEGGLS